MPLHASISKNWARLSFASNFIVHDDRSINDKYPVLSGTEICRSMSSNEWKRCDRSPTISSAVASHTTRGFQRPWKDSFNNCWRKESIKLLIVPSLLLSEYRFISVVRAAFIDSSDCNALDSIKSKLVFVTPSLGTSTLSRCFFLPPRLLFTRFSISIALVKRSKSREPLAKKEIISSLVNLVVGCCCCEWVPTTDDGDVHERELNSLQDMSFVNNQSHACSATIK